MAVNEAESEEQEFVPKKKKSKEDEDYEKRNNCKMIPVELMGCFRKHLKLVLVYRSISGQEISVLILSGQYIAIALVDKIKLRQSSLEDTCIPECFAGSSDYTGHYVVVCGYDVDTDEFEIRDPASLRKDERVSLECFDDARKSSGTDEDILVISLNGKDDD